MNRTLPWTLLALVSGAISLTSLPSTAHAVSLTSSPGGFLFDITETANGYVGNGTNDAYDFMYYLSVNGTDYNAGGAATSSLGGRQYDMREIAMGSLMVSRHAYVPASGGNWIRYYDLIRNPTGSAVMATIQIHGGLGADAFLEITGSSTGDILVTDEDDWFTTDDNMPTSLDTPTGHVVQGPNGRVRATGITAMPGAASATLAWNFSVMVPAGGEVAILTYGIQEADRATTITTSQDLVNPACSTTGADPLNGLSNAQRASIVNFTLAGAPLPCFSAPANVDEGDAIPVDVTVTDLEGDPSISWTFDLDGDGTFGEMADAAMVTVPMGVTDGPAPYLLGIETTDGTNTQRFYRGINVANVAPIITSSPRTVAAIRREYQYMVTLDDPASAHETYTYTLASRPMGMTADASGTITWTPTVDQRGMSYPVILRVEDGDGGEAIQTWEIEVAENTTPDAPVPMSPIDRVYVSPDSAPTLVVENGMDGDGDTLVYFFRLSMTSDTNNAPYVSGEVTEGSGGTTEWTPPEPLAPGLWYWDVWVDDGIGESAHRYAQFISGDMQGLADAGGSGFDAGTGGGVDAGPGGGGDGGCSIGRTQDRSAAPMMLLLAGLGLALIRRRRA
ncbi:MAG: putative Ig domain-containing protein [Sandaracinaceae bacterium]